MTKDPRLDESAGTARQGGPERAATPETRAGEGRRAFLAKGGATAAAVATAAMDVAAVSCSTPLEADAAPPPGPRARPKPRGKDRVREAYRLRMDEARGLKDRPAADLRANGDDEIHPIGIASFSKGLPHDPRGEVDPVAFAALVSALDSGRPADLEAIPLGGVLKMVNPQAALAFGLEGAESAQLALRPPPSFASAETAGEACELYWQAITRDVAFEEYDGNPLVHQAAEDLSQLSAFAGPKEEGRVTAATLFRGATPGDRVGPYLSQFLWKEVPYGSIRLVQQVRTATPGIDYLVTWEDWLAVQNGAATPPKHGSAYRYIRSARDLAAYVQLDFTYQAFLSACLILFGQEGTTDVRRPYKGAPYDAGNPYRQSRTQSGFVTFGVANVLDLVARVASHALRACWYQKWLIHRRLRPEEYGGGVHNQVTGAARRPVHEDILNSRALPVVFAKHAVYLLPQAYSEGCPLHPSYPAGHATVAGACATVLKALFHEPFSIDDPVVASADGLRLLPYKGRDLTVGGELNKLASNVALGRGAAGIHWRSDSIEGLRLGEAVALALLAESRACFNEDFGGYSLTKFDGTTVTV